MNEEEDVGIEKMRKEIESNQDSAFSLCTEKVLLARQAYDLVSFTVFEFVYLDDLCWTFFITCDVVRLNFP